MILADFDVGEFFEIGKDDFRFQIAVSHSVLRIIFVLL